MRSSLLIFAVGCLLATATAQQQESPKSKPEKSRAEQSAAKPAESKPASSPGISDSRSAWGAREPGRKSKTGTAGKGRALRHDRSSAGRDPPASNGWRTITEVHRDRGAPSHQAGRWKDRRRNVFRRVHTRRAGSSAPSPHVCFQRRPGIGLNLAAHGRTGAKTSCSSTWRLYARSAIPLCGQRLHCARQD